MFASFASGIVDTGGKFATGINNTSGTAAKFAAGVPDTGGKFATGVFDTGSLRTSPHIFKKFERTLMLFSGAWRRLIHEENLKQKIS